MAWWRRTRGQDKGASRGGGSGGRDQSVVERHLTTFAQSRRGVEAYVEPSTNVTETTLVLIAFDGEWTRRAMPSREAAFRFATKLSLPVYDVNQTGYPARMREWTSRQRREGRA